MLNVERLDCLNRKYHKDCVWVNAKIRYPDTRYLLLRDRLVQEVKKTKIAYRITHWKFGVLVTIKAGHDNSLYIGEHEDALKQFALYGGD